MLIELDQNFEKIHDFSKQRNVPNEAIENAIKSLKSSDGNLSTDIRGSLELRKSIAQKVYNYNALDIDPEKGFQRKSGDSMDRIESSGLKFFDDVRNGYLQLANQHSRINSTLPPLCESETL